MRKYQISDRSDDQIGPEHKQVNGLPTDQYVKLIPLEITDETHDLYYAEVNYLLMRHVY